ncbi:sulfur carrier protein ThiS adenylyltransferase ThiF [Malonomonas rubra]|uniref:sulfur carrier protein ThiS adenylyltransferase ThiF n=1 Tax=Malonomonas rubra TaxID=57040 RepID=UPI0026E9D893|nr:sulfur carrier protein ThiS adenylyltransferase ThiF [Malonomonas rubra]
MLIYLNEQPEEIAGELSLFALREQKKPQADLLIVNGYPTSNDQALKNGDRVVLIQRGEEPSTEELERLIRARHTPGVHEKIKNSCVGIAGVGGLGSNIAIALARIGVGKLVLVDFDVVEPSNLNRQQYFIDQIGLPKVEALKANLARINPGVEVVAHYLRVTGGNLAGLFASVDVLVEAFDAAEQKAMLTSNFLTQMKDKPLIAASGMAGYGSSNSIQTLKISDRFYLCGDGTTAAEPGCGLMAPRVGIAAHHQANAVLRLLLGEEPE